MKAIAIIIIILSIPLFIVGFIYQMLDVSFYSGREAFGNLHLKVRSKI